MIVLFSCYLNHHQSWISDELYKLSNNDFIFVATTPIPIKRLQSGYPEIKRPYLLKAYEDEVSRTKALHLAQNADVVIFGSDCFEYQVERMRYSKFSFEMSERWLKRGWVNLLSPRLIKNIWYYFKDNWGNKPLYKLCSSAYCAEDQYKLHTFKDRCYKWGYFTEVKELDIENIIANREQIKDTSCFTTPKSVKILWCARFLGWKHPELIVMLAQQLKANRYDVTIDMYGSGDELEPTQRLCEKLRVEDIINFKGNVPNEKILEVMQEHDIFLFTSDKNEGWGAVLNEAMSNGCTVVASDEIGSVPFLVNDGINGYIFKSKNLDSLYEKVVKLIENPELRKIMAIQAYSDMVNIWSPKVAANNLIRLIGDLQHSRETSITCGPCSKA